MFDNLNFKSAVASTRGALVGSPVVITHNKGKNKEEHTYKISREAMDKCGFLYGDKVDIQFSPDFNVCRIIKAATGLTLSQQTSTNEKSAAVMRMLFRENLHPNLLQIANAHNESDDNKAIFENGEIEYKEGCLTFVIKQP